MMDENNSMNFLILIEAMLFILQINFHSPTIFCLMFNTKSARSNLQLIKIGKKIPSTL